MGFVLPTAAAIVVLQIILLARWIAHNGTVQQNAHCRDGTRECLESARICWGPSSGPLSRDPGM